MDNLSRIFVILLSILVLVGAGIGLYLYILSKSSLESGPAAPSREFIPEEVTQGAKEESFEKCSLTRTKHPLLSFLETTENSLNGTVSGTISQPVETESDVVNIEVESYQRLERHKFTIQDKQGLILETGSNKELGVKDLKLGDRLLISFRCNRLQQNDFQINRIVVVEKK